MSRLRVWWIPQIPGKAFEVAVPDLPTANLITNILADYDLFQYENKIKPDYANAGGIQSRDSDSGEWEDLDDEDGAL